MADLNDFVKWQAEDINRSVRIDIKTGLTYAFVYDGCLEKGQVVTGVDQIDLVGEKKKEELKQYKRLKEKYEGAI